MAVVDTSAVERRRGHRSSERCHVWHPGPVATGDRLSQMPVALVIAVHSSAQLLVMAAAGRLLFGNSLELLQARLLVAAAALSLAACARVR
jgi:hypothetical protein